MHKEYSKEAINQNIKDLIKEGKSHKQAVAIAISKSEKQEHKDTKHESKESASKERDEKKRVIEIALNKSKN